MSCRGGDGDDGGGRDHAVRDDGPSWDANAHDLDHANAGGRDCNSKLESCFKLALREGDWPSRIKS